MNRRKLWPAWLAALALIAAACGGGEATTTQPPATEPPATEPGATQPPETQPPAAAEKTIIIGTTDSISGLDSADAYAVHDWELIRNTGVGLMSFAPGTAEIQPGLAESFDVSDDGLTYTFNLRPGVAFYDGTPLTAGDYVAHLNRMLNLDGDGGVGGALGKPYIKCDEALEVGCAEWGVSAPDDSTVVIELSSAVSYFPQITTGAPYMPMHPSYPADALVEFPEGVFGGVGPWVVTDYTVGEQTVLEPNPNWFGDPPKVDRIIIQYFVESAQLVAALQAGDVDVAWRSVQEPDLLEAISGAEGIDGGVVPGGPIRYLIINRDLAPSDDINVRKAIAAAIDRSEFVDGPLGGNATELYSPIPPGFLGASDVYDEQYASPNQELAISLLEASGYSADNKLQLTIDYPPNRYGGVVGDVMQVLERQLEDTGLIEAETQATEWATYLGNVIGAQYAVSFLGWFFDYPDSSNWVEPFTLFGGLGTRATAEDNTPAAGHEDLVATMQAAATETDSAARSALYGEVETMYADLVVTIPLWVEPERVFYKSCISGDPNVPAAQTLNIGPTTDLNYDLLDTSC